MTLLANALPIPEDEATERAEAEAIVRATRAYALDLVLAYEIAARTIPVPENAEPIGAGMIAAGSVFLGICRARGLDAVAALCGVAGLAIPQTTTVH